MAFLDRFRRRPGWESPDPEVRAEAVRQVGADDQALLAEVARHDPDARVRRAAVRRLKTADALAAVAADADENVREQALDALLGFAGGADAGAAEAALAALSETRHLVSVARSAALARIRRAALLRIQEPRALASVARTAANPGVRLEALARVNETALAVEVACKTGHKDVAVAAVERLDDREALAEVAAHSRNRAAVRRATAKLEALEPVPAEEPPERPVVGASAAESGAAEPSSSEPTVETAPASDAAASEPEAPPTAPPTVAAPSDAALASGLAPPPAEEAVAVRARAEREEQGHAEEHPRRAALARIEALCGRLEARARAADLALRDAHAALREARAAQDELGGAPARLARRLKAARAALFARSQELREADEWTRWGNAAVQEELCRRVEALASRDDHEHVARELHETDARWAEVRHAPREEAEALRRRYQTARAQVKARLDAYFARKAEGFAANAREKTALCERAEALADSTEWLKASEELKALQARWKGIGPTSRKASQVLWKRFRSACDRFFTRRQEDLKRRKEEWGRNLAGKEALCVRAEALVESSDWEASAAEIRRLQAEWRIIGPVRKNRSEAVWQRFRKACDAFFERYRRRDELALAAKRAERQAICDELERLVPADGAQAQEGLADKVQALLARARQAPLPRDEEASWSQRFHEARDRLIAASPGGFRGTDLDPEANRAKKEKLCARVEALLAAAEADGGDDQPLSGEALARRLKEALAANTIGGAGDAEARRRAEIQEVEAAQAAWKRLGPVPGETGAALGERFEKACGRLLEARRRSTKDPRRAQSARP